jgi:hypothetical protein
LACCACLVSILNTCTVCQAATGEEPKATSRLLLLASAQFPNLTAAERSLLWFSDAMNIGRGAIAVAGPSSNPADPGNDPAHADKWDAQRNVRAALIRWMCADRRAIELEDPGGIRVMGARIAGALDLAHLHVPAPLVAGRNRFGRVRDIRAESSDPRLGAALLSVAANHGGMATERGVHRRVDRPDSKRLRSAASHTTSEHTTPAAVARTFPARYTKNPDL